MNSTSSSNNQPSPHGQCVCPPWLCFTFDNIFRKLLQNPEHILKPYVKKRWTILDVGPGMGYYTIPLARLVGDTGKVIAADLQRKMLDGIYHRAVRAGVQDRIRLQLSKTGSIGITEPVDFCLAFWMVHEIPDRSGFLNEISTHLKPEGLLLLVEPRLHVSRKDFEQTLVIAEKAGLSKKAQPDISISYAALYKKNSK